MTQIDARIRTAVGTDLTVLRGWNGPDWLRAASAAGAAAVVTGIPTEIIDTALFARPIPVEAWAYPVWAASSILIGLVVAAILRGRRDDPSGRTVLGGGLLSFVAVGCPTCNVVVVTALGTGGALSIFAPVQPVLAGAALAVLVVALHRQLRGPRCPIPPAVPSVGS